MFLSIQGGEGCALEQGGHIRHEDRSLMPLHRFYRLRQRGRALLADLSRISPPRVRTTAVQPVRGL